jgi:RNA polymerase sigma factor (sigma-70 family)
MSPSMLRRYRAERMLRRDFQAMRERVLASVRANLGARRIVLDESDLEACYSQAWQGLYTALAEGQEIENHVGWLMKVCFRRAIDECRRSVSEQQKLEGSVNDLHGRAEPDIVDALDDHVKLRHTFEALRQRLDAREQQAVSLCYLQGLTRAQAAEQMGISESRMRKLMEGRGPERPGVAAKLDSLLKIVQGGDWCEQQASLMRGLAFGVHDPDGERYRLARLHYRACPACRAYVRSLRGLAVVLPPLALPWAPGMAGGLGGALGGGAGAGGAAGGAGGWLPLGGSLGAKIAAGCLLFAGVGGGCVALIAKPGQAKHVRHRHDLAHNSVGSAPGSPLAFPVPLPALPVHRVPRRASARVVSAAHPARSRSAGPAVDAAQRELGFERPARVRASKAPPPRGAESEFAPG